MSTSSARRRKLKICRNLHFRVELVAKFLHFRRLCKPQTQNKTIRANISDGLFVKSDYF